MMAQKSGKSVNERVSYPPLAKRYTSYGFVPEVCYNCKYDVIVILSQHKM